VTELRALRIYHSAVVSDWRRRDRELRRHAIDLVLLSPRRWNEGGEVVEFDSTGDDFVHAISTFGQHPFRFVYAPWSLWRAFRERPLDIIDTHEEPASLAVGEVLVLRRLLQPRAKLLLYCAENIPKRYPVPFRWIERWALRSASAVYCCNEAAATIIRSKGFRGEIEVLGLGVDVDQLAPEPASRQRAGLHLGYVGRLDERKGVQVVLDALTQLPDSVTFTIAGTGPYAGALQAKARDTGLGDRARFLSYVDHAQVAQLYRTFDAVVVPSLPTKRWHEQFCRVAVEAMTTGAPVIASDDGALPEVVGPGGVTVPAGDVHAWVEAIKLFANDAELRARYSEQARQWADRYSWPAIAERHAELYARVAR
jgi:glycosyltransferase involved in cell wall biosynthesis